MFLFTESRPAVRPTQFPVRWVPGALPPKDKAAWREGGGWRRPPTRSAEAKNVGPALHFSIRFRKWFLIKHRDILTEQLTVYADTRNNYLLLSDSNVHHHVRKGSPSNPNMGQFTSLMC
jgi:hypothetical protein